MDDAGVQWLSLPPELWPAIGKRLDNYIDVVRFRSVCRLWRASIPPFDDLSPSVRPQFPSPINSANLSVDAFLSQTTVYRLGPLDHEPNPHFSTSSSPHRKGWLVKVEKVELGKKRFLHPLFKRQIRYRLEALPKEQKELNLLDLRIDELANSYSLRYTDAFYVPGITKVVPFPNSTGTTDVKDSTIIAVYEEGKLGFTRCGDEKWTLIDDQNFHYDDVMSYKGQNYAVDRWGTVFWIDLSMRLVQFSPPLCGFGNQKHLVESGGELYVIDRFLDKDRLFWNPIEVDDAHPYVIPARRPYESLPKATDFKVYKLDEEWGRWVEIKNLGNRSFVLGNDCSFSVSASEFEGCKRNCIYFTDINDDEYTGRGCSRVFDLKERRMGNILAAHPGHIEIFRPSPIWLSKPPPLREILSIGVQHRHENQL